MCTVLCAVEIVTKVGLVGVGKPVVGGGVEKSLSNSESNLEKDSYSSEFFTGEGAEIVGSVDFSEVVQVSECRGCIVVGVGSAILEGSGG